MASFNLTTITYHNRKHISYTNIDEVIQFYFSLYPHLKRKPTKNAPISRIEKNLRTIILHNCAKVRTIKID